MGKLIKFLALQKFRFDSGQTILAVVNFMLLLYVASSNLADRLKGGHAAQSDDTGNLEDC